jgi:predicted AAA+ superfamily ATPase
MTYIERAVADVLAEAMGSARVVILLGPRQAGKSTLRECSPTTACPRPT